MKRLKRLSCSVVRKARRERRNSSYFNAECFSLNRRSLMLKIVLHDQPGVFLLPLCKYSVH